MPKKTKILVIGNTLSIGGVQKALLGLLNAIDYERYEVALLLTKTDGELLSYIDKRVKILVTPSFFSWVLLPKNAILKSIKSLLSSPILLYYFTKCIIGGQFKGNMAQARQRMWKSVIKYFPNINGEYDVALDFSGLFRCYVLNKVDAKRKYTWIHSDYRVFGYDKEIDEPLLDGFDKIFCVSDTCKEIFDAEFPLLARKSEVLLNVIDLNFIKQQLNGKSFNDGFNGVRLLDVTRLDPNKGLDIAVRVCSRLKKKSINFRWYILGNDPLDYRKELEKLIDEFDVRDTFILLGFSSNPYPYMNDADLIVHFSRFEGRSVFIDEALALEKKIMLTNYPTAKDQIKHGVNGYICDFDEEELIKMLKGLIESVKC